jgi:isopentenyl-diphosphate delta-isomerase
MKVAEVDTNDRVLGVVSRSQLLKRGKNFRVVHVLVWNGCHELLLQRLPDTHERHPGRWGMSIAGYVAAGETYRNAARRKLQAELRASSFELRWLGKTMMRDERSKKYVGVFATKLSGEFLPNAADFAGLRFVDTQEVERMIAHRSDDFTPTFVHVFRYLMARGKLAID